MSAGYDFERAWLDKFDTCLQDTVSDDIRQQIMAGSEGLSAASDRDAVIDWTQTTMDRLDGLLDAPQKRSVLTGCACRYPQAGLLPIREHYQQTRDIEAAHSMLQSQFESMLRDTLSLDETLIAQIVELGWGSAGIIESDRIVATKIPKSGYLVEYMQTSDPEQRRQLYCHCPRIRASLKTPTRISPTYCYCGAGFYKGIWEEILQQPVRVEVLESVLGGGDICKIAIYLPPGL